MRSKLFVLLLVPLCASCSALGPDCTDELEVRLVPHTRTIGVEESFTPSLTLWSCGGRERLSDTFQWTSSDPLIVSADPVTGRITGRSAGFAYVHVTGQRYGPLGAVEATVR